MSHRFKLLLDCAGRLMDQADLWLRHGLTLCAFTLNNGPQQWPRCSARSSKISKAQWYHRSNPASRSSGRTLDVGGHMPLTGIGVCRTDDSTAPLGTLTPQWKQAECVSCNRSGREKIAIRGGIGAECLLAAGRDQPTASEAGRLWRRDDLEPCWCIADASISAKVKRGSALTACSRSRSRVRRDRAIPRSLRSSQRHELDLWAPLSAAPCETPVQALFGTRSHPQPRQTLAASAFAPDLTFSLDMVSSLIDIDDKLIDGDTRSVKPNWWVSTAFAMPFSKVATAFSVA